MDCEKLSVKFLRGYEIFIKDDGLTHKDKVLPYLSIVYPRKGAYRVCLEDEEFVYLDENNGCFIVAPYVRHTIIHKILHSEDNMIPRWVFITILYDGHLDVTSWFSPPLLVEGELSDTFRRIVDEAIMAEDDGFGFTKLRLSGEILENLLKISEFVPRFENLLPIYPALMMMRKSFASPLFADGLAEACHMSRATFFRTFLKIMNKTPFEYISEIRISQAAQMLINTALPLSTIAKECGFCDEFHLSKNFKKIHGITPSEYRKHGVM